MDRFCGKCGSPVGSADRCPNCGWVMPTDPAPKEKEKKKAKTKPKTKLILMIAAAVVLVALLVLGAVLLFGSSKAESREDPGETLARPDAEAYLSEYGDITDRVSAKRAPQLTEAEAVRAFAARGFSDVTVTADYNTEGVWLDKQEISREGAEKHPYYEARYLTPDEIFWTVTLVGDTFYAVPTGYNLEYGWDVLHMVSETGSFRSYDSRTNMFYTISPQPSALVLKRVERIDAETLDGLRAWEVDEP